MPGCPNCGAEVTADANRCLRCMAVFTGPGWQPVEGAGDRNSTRIADFRFVYGIVIPTFVFVVFQGLLLFHGLFASHALVTAYEAWLLIAVGVVAIPVVGVVNWWTLLVAWKEKGSAILGGLILPTVIATAELGFTYGDRGTRELWGIPLIPFWYLANWLLGLGK